MRDESQTLEAIKKNMSPEKRRQMAELLAKELEARREAAASRGAAKSGVKMSRLGGSLNREDLADVYRNMRQTREEKANRQQNKGLRSQLLSLHLGLQSISARNVLIIFGIVACGVLKVLLSIGVVNASDSAAAKAVRPVEKASAAEVSSDAKEVKANAVPNPSQAEAPMAEPDRRSEPDRRLVGWSVSEKTLLTQLDARRVELEQRKSALDSRENELKTMEGSIAERIAELKSLTRKLEEVKQEKDHLQDARLEQLANVYGSMAPNEAAPLIAKLDNDVALALLGRMPSKRMGQILGLMDAERAIELTKNLTDKKK